MRLTWEAELAQLLPSEATSKSCDKPLTQVEALVRFRSFFGGSDFSQVRRAPGWRETLLTPSCQVMTCCVQNSISAYQ